MDLAKHSDLGRHVLGCAMLDSNGALLAQCGALCNEAASAGRALVACMSSLGCRGEASFAVSMDWGGTQLVARTDRGRILVVRTDGQVSMSEELFSFVTNVLAPPALDQNPDDPLRDTCTRIRVPGSRRTRSRVA
jgi:hypothetical protein